MREEKEFLKTEPIGRLLLRLAFPTGRCGYVYWQAGADGLYHDSPSDLYGCDVPFRNTDGVSDDV